MIQALFIITLTISIFNIIKLIGIACGNSISLPGIIAYEFSAPDRWYFFYPAFGFQVWFWSQTLFI
jgi:hypothetical protein